VKTLRLSAFRFPYFRSPDEQSEIRDGHSSSSIVPGWRFAYLGYGPGMFLAMAWQNSGAQASRERFRLFTSLRRAGRA